jgi:Domain of unknown function (DUF4893)
VLTPKGLLFGAALLTLSTAAQAGWQEDATPFDVNRISKLDESRAKGLSEAQAGSDMGTIHAVLDPAPEAIGEGALAGKWRCRTIKLGGLTPDVVYSWFNCRISHRDGALFFEKVTGSQRVAGVLYPREDGGYVLLGAASVGNEPPHRYSGNHESAGAEATPDDAVGVLSGIGANRARIEFPYPVQESTFDVIELKR